MNTKKHTFIIWAMLLGFGIALSGCAGGMNLLKADFSMTNKNYAAAIPELEAYLAIKPEAIKPRGKLGFAYLKTGQIDKAISAFETVQELKPGEPLSVLYLGLAYLNKGDMNKAIETWEIYRNQRAPLVEAEIRRQLTLLLIAQSRREAKQALAQEEQLDTIEPDEDTIAVFYYRDMTSDQKMDAFQKGLAAMVITDISKIKSLKVVERLRMQALLEEMQLGQLGIVDERTAPRVGRLLGAKNVIVGSLHSGSIEAATTVNKVSSSARVDTENFWEIPKFVLRTVVKALGINLSPEEEAALGLVHTKSLEAFTFWGQALLAQDAGNWKEAKDFYTKALAADPSFALAAAGNDGCPDASAPSLAALSTMTAAQLSAGISRAVETAVNDQNRDDQENEEKRDADSNAGTGHDEKAGNSNNSSSSSYP